MEILTKGAPLGLYFVNVPISNNVCRCYFVAIFYGSNHLEQKIYCNIFYNNVLIWQHLLQQHLGHVAMSFGNNISSINISHPFASKFFMSTLAIFWQHHPLAKTSRTTSFCNNDLNNVFATIVFTIFVVFNSSKPSIKKIISIIFIVFIINIISTYHLCCLYNKHHFCNLYCLCNKHHLYNQHVIFVVFIANIIFTSNI